MSSLLSDVCRRNGFAIKHRDEDHWYGEIVDGRVQLRLHPPADDASTEKWTWQVRANRDSTLLATGTGTLSECRAALEAEAEHRRRNGPGNRFEQAVNWAALGDRFQQIQGDMVHREDAKRHGADFYGEALRRLVALSPELMLTAYADDLRDAHTTVDRVNREVAEARTKEVIAEYRTEKAALARDLAEQVRGMAGQLSGKLRREGVELAAAWLERQTGGAR